jgi:hypothetical protein
LKDLSAARATAAMSRSAASFKSSVIVSSDAATESGALIDDSARAVEDMSLPSDSIVDMHAGQRYQRRVIDFYGGGALRKLAMPV